MIKKKICVALSSALLLSMMMSCTPENEFIRSNGQMGSLAFSVSVADEDEPSSTRSESYVVDTFVVGNDTLCLICTETDMADSAPEVEETSATRGEPIYTQPSTGTFNLETVYKQFNLSAYKQTSSGLADFTENNLDADGKTVTGTNPYEDITYVFDGVTYGYEKNSGGTKTGWEYWSPYDQEKAGKYFWWEDNLHKTDPDKNYVLEFFAYSPTASLDYPKKWDPSVASVDMKYDVNGKITFKHTVPTGGTGTYAGKDAEVQPDILVGSTKGLDRSSVDKETINSKDYYVVPLKFFHALSGVRFCIAKPSTASGSEEDDLTGYTIESITLSNLCPSGTCTLSYPSSPAKAPKDCVSSEVISWSSYGTPNGTYTQTFNHTIADGSKEGEMAYGTTTSQTFMLLPQTLGETTSKAPNAEVSIVLKDKAGVTQVLKVQKLTGSKSTGVSAWLPGKMYTYKIATKQKDVKVTINDSWNKSTKTKSGLKIKNTGTTAAYIRVAAVANWYNTGSTLTYPYNATKWTSDVDAHINTKWAKCADGYYYYKYPVPANTEIGSANTLFSSVTFTDIAPGTDWHLEVNLVVQAVRTNDVEDAWGSAFTDGVIVAAGLQKEPID